MKTREEVREFFESRGVSAGGAERRYIITVTDKVSAGGDIWSHVSIPLWGDNKHVVRGVVKLLWEVAEWCPDVKMYATDGHIILQIAEYVRPSA